MAYEALRRGAGRGGTGMQTTDSTLTALLAARASGSCAGHAREQGRVRERACIGFRQRHAARLRRAHMEDIR